jgi:hypothetical protein
LYVLDKIPLTPHGKVDRRTLVNITAKEAVESRSKDVPAENSGITIFVCGYEEQGFWSTKK